MKGRNTLVAALAIFLLLGCTERDGRTGETRRAERLDVQGHRGARGLLPENTLPAFEHAIALGVTTLELDVGMTRDGVVVVSHDRHISPAICRREDGTAFEGREGPALRSLTLGEVRALDCGSLNPDPLRFPEPPRRNIPGTGMPTLAEVLALGRRPEASDVAFNVEIKAVPGGEATAPMPEFATAVVMVVREAGMLERTTIQSFLWDALRTVKQIEPRIRTAALLSRSTLEAAWLGGLDPTDAPDVGALLGASASFVDDYSPHYRLLLDELRRDPRHLADIQAAGFRVIPWTVNDAADMRRLIDLGVDGIITDYPDRLIEELR